MDPDRDGKDQDCGQGPEPKLSLAGRLDGFLAGRPVSLVAEGRAITLISDNFSSLLKLRRSWRRVLRPLLATLEREDIRLVVQTKWLGRIEVFPRPKYLVRVFLR